MCTISGRPLRGVPSDTSMSDDEDESSMNTCIGCGKEISSDDGAKCNQCMEDICEDCYEQCSCDSFSFDRRGYSSIHACGNEIFCPNCAWVYFKRCPVSGCRARFWTCADDFEFDTPPDDFRCCCFHLHVKECRELEQRRRDVARALGIRILPGGAIEQHTGDRLHNLRSRWPGAPFHSLPPEMVLEIFRLWMSMQEGSHAETRFQHLLS